MTYFFMTLGLIAIVTGWLDYERIVLRKYVK